MFFLSFYTELIFNKQIYFSVSFAEICRRNKPLKLIIMPLIKLTDYETNEPILVGTEQIIEVREFDYQTIKGTSYKATSVKSVGGMVTSNKVKETVEQIYSLYNN